MRRARAVLLLELALLLAVWPFFWWATLATRHLFYRTPEAVRLVCQASPWLMALDTIPGLLGLWALGGVKREERGWTCRLAALLCLPHIAAGCLLIGMWLVIRLITVFLGFIF